MAFIERWAGWIEDSPIEVDRKASIKAAIEKLIKFHIETKIKRLCSHEIESTQIDTPEVGIRIEIPNQQAVVPLLSCLNNYAMPETLNGTNRVRCETCKQNVDATKTFKIDKFPRYLIIQLKRIMQQVGVTYGHNIIVETPISIPSELIINTNSEFISARLKAELGEGSTTYKLCAFISHRFTLSHYIAYVRDKKHWYKYDDMRDTPLIVKKIELQNILDSGKDGKFMPTILFYKKLQKHH
jgi:ubiquitin C-terminal hydrolase